MGKKIATKKKAKVNEILIDRKTAKAGTFSPATEEHEDPTPCNILAIRRTG